MSVIGILIFWLLLIAIARHVAKPVPLYHPVTSAKPTPPSRKETAIQLDQFLGSVSWDEVTLPSAKIKPISLQYFSTNFGATLDPSPAEQLIIDELMKYDVKWEREVSFPSLKLSTGGWGRFDFILPEHNTVIEYNSRQYHSIPQRAEIDQIKKDFCLSNNINLVTYTHKDYYHISTRIEELMKELSVLPTDKVLL